MRSIRSIFHTVGLTAVLLAVAAYTGLHKKENDSWQTPGSSKGFAVVELFTSEGCSSCPPADELVERIQRDNKDGQIYILAFHVDYWDHQGWKDRFSAPEFSKRQRQYASWLNLQTVYTPQIVVNGTTECVGSDKDKVLTAISDGLRKTANDVLRLNCKIEHARVNVSYQGGGNEKNMELVLALVQRSAQTQVRAGENAGKSLSHVQIVRRIGHYPVDINSKKNIVIDLPADFSAKGWELIGFIQRQNDGHITAAGRSDFGSGLAN